LNKQTTIPKELHSLYNISSVGIATYYRIGVRFPSGAGIFLFVTMSWPALGPTQPHIQWIPGGSFPGSKAPRARSWQLTLPPGKVPLVSTGWEVG